MLSQHEPAEMEAAKAVGPVPSEVSEGETEMEEVLAHNSAREESVKEIAVAGDSAPIVPDTSSTGLSLASKTNPDPVDEGGREAVGELAGSFRLTATGIPSLKGHSALKGRGDTRDLLSASEFAKLDTLGLDGVHLTLDNRLQQRAEKLLKDFRVRYGSIVAIEPQSGRVLTMASHSESEPDSAHLALRATFPAASLFKIITAAAAIEHAGLDRNSVIRYRGGNYTLNRYNFAPSTRDRKTMTLGLALGKSCNPAFARVALRHLNAQTLSRYAGYFGFNRSVGFDVPLEESSFQLPQGDYATARTAAGFQNAKISPLHAALIAASIGNRGVMMRPYIIDRFESDSAAYRAKPTVLGRAVLPSTATEVLGAMESSTTDGTARRQFGRSRNPVVKSMKIASKTGTLSGHDPEGVYHWFVAVAPADNPQIAIAALVINKGRIRVKGTGLGRRFLESYFETEPDLKTARSGGGSKTRSNS